MEHKLIKTEKVLGNILSVYGTPENPLFVAKDVAEWIGHTHPTNMVANIDEEDKLNVTLLRAGQARDMIMLTEDGLYEVLFQSRKPIAKSFKKDLLPLEGED